MKYTIKQLVRKPLQIQGRATEILTMLLVDEIGKEIKVKTWKSKWSDSFVERMALIDVQMEEKPGLDGFPEKWLINPDKGKGAFVSRITADNYNSLLVYNGGEPGNSTYVCFAPLSDAFTVKAENRCLGDAGEYGALSPDFPDEACDGTQKYYCLP